MRIRRVAIVGRLREVEPEVPRQGELLGGCQILVYFGLPDAAGPLAAFAGEILTEARASADLEIARTPGPS